MKKKEGIIVDVYEVGKEDFRVDVITIKEEAFTVYEAWLYRKTIGIKSLMFGCDAKDIAYEDFCRLIEANLNDIDGYNYYDNYDEDFN